VFTKKRTGRIAGSWYPSSRWHASEATGIVAPIRKVGTKRRISAPRA
jgi:hypothetical protein